MDYKAILENIYDEATSEEKREIDEFFSMIKTEKEKSHLLRIAEKIIRKYRPQYFTENK